VKIVTEKDFLGLIQASVVHPALESGGGVSMNRSSSTSSVSRIVKSLAPRLERASSSSSSSSSPESSQLLWVDKYKPKRLEDVIGAAESIRKILDWLKKWPEVHIRKTVKVVILSSLSLSPSPLSLLLIRSPSPKRTLARSPFSSLVLEVSLCPLPSVADRPAGIGKTTLATLVAKSLGYEVLEFNASDVRSKNAIVAQVSDVVHSQALGVDGKLRKRLVIMDEVDGMGGSDRGGIPELIKVIKSSSTPIICICNDR
jgi:replication factor C subunit 1